MLKQIAERFPLFIVGGFCRDELLGVPANDRDYVCVATKSEFESHFPELKCVGNSFPVYLNPSCGSEIALSRIEKSTGNSYQDFDCVSGVSIEEDLSRRDITINSFCKCFTTGRLVDPLGGVEDIKNKVIRCSNPEAFMEDSVRILRVLRFKAKHPEFTIELETRELMKENVHLLQHVAPERVCLEMEKMYKSAAKPSQFFEMLHEIGGLHIHFKPLFDLTNIFAGPSHTKHGENTTFQHIMECIDRCKVKNYSYEVFLSVLFHDVGKFTSSKKDTYANGLRHHYSHEVFGRDIIDAYFPTMRFTANQEKLIRSVMVNHMIHNIAIMKNIKLVRFFKRVKNVFDDFVKACDCDFELVPEQIVIFERLKRTFKEAVIDVPKSIKDRRDDTITIHYVEHILEQKYKELK